MTRIIVTGSRDWPALHVAETILHRLLVRYGDHGFCIVHGDCRTGVDAAFEDAA
jgi:hypothetical protein